MGDDGRFLGRRHYPDAVGCGRLRQAGVPDAQISPFSHSASQAEKELIERSRILARCSGQVPGG